MTKKDYIAIADAIAEAILESDLSNSAVRAQEAIIFHLGKYFASDNAAFSDRRFTDYITKKVSAAMR